MNCRIIDGMDALRALAGQEVARSGWLDVTQQMIDSFANVTQDWQWIHIDSQRAAADSPYGSTVAHGYLTLSLLTRLAQEAFQVRGCRLRINYGLNRVRFPSPVPAGSRIRAIFVLAEVQDFQGGLQAVWSVTVEREGAGKPVLVAETLTRFYR